MISIFIGRAGRRQSEAVYDDILSLPENEKAFVVVPDQFTYETERRILRDKSVSLHTEVLSLKRLSYRLEGECVEEKINLISSEADNILIRRAVSLTAKDLGIFSGVCHTQGFCEEITEFISELKKGDIDISSLSFNEDEGENIREKLSDIKKIYEKYLSLIPEGYISSDDYFSFIAERAVNSDTIRNSHFYFDGFYSFDKNEYSLISLIMRSAKSVTFSFITDDEKLFHCPGITLNEILQIIDEYSLEYKITENNDTTLLTAEGKFLEENLFGYDRVAYATHTDRINLIKAQSKTDECDYVGCEINRLIRNEGYRYSDFQIIATDKTYFSLLRNILPRHNIEFFIDENREISSTSPVRAFLYILDMLSGMFTTNEVISFSKSGFATVTEEEYMLLENYALETGIKSFMWEKDFVKNNPEESYDLEYINEIRRKLIGPVISIRKKVRGYENVAEFVRSFSSSLEEIRFEETIQKYIDEFISAGDYETANIYSQINNKILLILSALEEFFGEEYLTPREIYDILTFALSSCKVGIIPSRVDAVSVGDVIRSVNKNPKVMFILGCAEGLMPQSDYRHPILNDRERDSLTSISLKNSGDYLRKRENYVYYTYIASPKDRLYLSYADGNDDTYPSQIYERIREIFPGANCPDVRNVLYGRDMVDTKQYAFYKISDLIKDISSDEENIPEKNAIKIMMNSLEGNDEYEKLSLLNDGFHFDNDSTLKNKTVYSSMLADPFVSSVSMLEKYASCPFSFFMNYLVRPKERKLHAIKTTDIGSILHKIVEEISVLIIEDRIDVMNIWDEEIVSLTEKITDKVLSSYGGGIAGDITHSKYLYRKVMNSALSAVKELFSQLRRSDFEMHDSETSFGVNSKYEPIELTTDDERKVLVRGIIDRIDYASLSKGKFLKIVDYKTSKRNFDISKLNGRLSFQLPAYALAVKKDHEVAGVYYFKLASTPVTISEQKKLEDIVNDVRDDKKLHGLTLRDAEIVFALDREADNKSFIGNVSFSKKTGDFLDREGLFTREEFDSIMNLATDGMKKTAQGILDGDISINPYRYGKNENACTYCEYKGICKFSTSFEKNSFRKIEKVNKDVLLKGGEND